MGIVERGLVPRPVATVAARARRWSLWALPVGRACCSGELEAALRSTRVDVQRVGVLPVGDPAVANVLVVAGPLLAGRQRWLAEAFDVLPHPRYLMAVGACALSGGPFRDDLGGWSGPIEPPPAAVVDVYVPGCPPRPEAILDGIERLRARIATESAAERWQLAVSPVEPASGLGFAANASRGAGAAAPLCRGVERVVERLRWGQVTPVLARVDEAGAVARAVGFARAVETLAGHEPDPAIERARGLLGDMATLRHVTGWFARLARLLGLELVEASSWRARESVLDAFEQLTGARIHGDAVRPGRTDLHVSAAALDALHRSVTEVWAWTRGLDRLLFGVGVVAAELRGLAPIDHDTAVAHSLSGPNARATAPGAAAAEGALAAHRDGDAWARAWVRAQDARAACQAVRAWAAAPPTVAELAGHRLEHPGPGVADAWAAHPEGHALCTVVSDGGARPWRVRVNGPGGAARSVADHALRAHDLDGRARDLAYHSFAVDPGETDR